MTTYLDKGGEVPVAELLPCPFCGGPAELWRAHNQRPAWIGCMGRCAVLVTREHKTDAEAIETWNRRASTPQPKVDEGDGK